VAVSGPARRRWEAVRDHRAELVSPDHRHPGRRRAVEGDDAGPVALAILGVATLPWSTTCPGQDCTMRDATFQDVVLYRAIGRSELRRTRGPVGLTDSNPRTSRTGALVEAPDSLFGAPRVRRGHPDGHPDDPTGPDRIQRDRRHAPRDQPGSNWSQPGRR
jgi:hypothetical protein